MLTLFNILYKLLSLTNTHVMGKQQQQQQQIFHKNKLIPKNRVI
jgi:hypothetical protein